MTVSDQFVDTLFAAGVKRVYGVVSIPPENRPPNPKRPLAAGGPDSHDTITLGSTHS